MTASTLPPDTRETLLGIAAVSHLIDPAALAKMLDSDSPRVAAALLPDVDVDRGADGVARWTLRPAVRRRTLARANAATARTWIALSADPEPTETERILRAWLTGTFDVEQSLEASSDAVRQVAGWLRGCDWIRPQPADVYRAIARRELRQQLERAESPAFVGRTRELHDLGSLLDREPGIAVVEAKGGMGKSALLARLLLERGAFTSSGPLVMIVDFDDPAMSLLEPDAIFAELARQAALQESGFDEFERSFREHGAQSRAIETRDSFEDSRFLYLFSHFLDALLRRRRQATLVLDTLERAIHATPRLVNRFLQHLLMLVSSHGGLSLLVSGRGPFELPTLASVPRLQLSPLGVADARLMLRRLGVGEAVSTRILDIVVPTPLTLRLAARAVAKLGADAFNDGRLRSAVAKARVDGYLHARVLAHLPSPRISQVARLAVGLLAITPERLFRIVGPLIDPPVASLPEGEEVFMELAVISDLVSAQASDRRLIFRAEVSLELLELLHEEDPGGLNEVHERACEVLEGAVMPADKIERAYHLLALERLEGLEWTPELAASLEYLSPTLPEASRAWLARPRGPSLSDRNSSYAFGLVAGVAQETPPAADCVRRVELALQEAESDEEAGRAALESALPGSMEWAQLAEKRRDLVRRAAAHLGTRDALCAAARVGAFEWTGSLDFSRLALALERYPHLKSTLELVGDAHSSAQDIEAAQHHASLGSFVLLVVQEAGDDDELRAALVNLLVQMRSSGPAAPAGGGTFRSDGTAPPRELFGFAPEERAARLEELATIITATMQDADWRDVVLEVSRKLDARWLHGEQFELAVRNALSEIDRRQLGNKLASTLYELGFDQQGTLASELFAKGEGESD